MEETRTRKGRRAQAWLLGESRQGAEALQGQEGRRAEPAEYLSDHGHRRPNRLDALRDDAPPPRGRSYGSARGDGLPRGDQRVPRGGARQAAYDYDLRKIIFTRPAS